MSNERLDCAKRWRRQFPDWVFLGNADKRRSNSDAPKNIWSCKDRLHLASNVAAGITRRLHRFAGWRKCKMREAYNQSRR
jgi:hypothetical protein